MTSVLSAKLYRLRRQKSPVVILVLTAFFASFMAFSLGSVLGNSSFALNMQAMLRDSLQTTTNMYNQAVIAEMLEMVNHYSLNTVSSYMALGLSGDLLFLLFLFIIYYSNATIRNGFLKNALPNVKRSFLFYADAAILLGYTVLLVLGYLLVFAAFGPLFFKGLPFGNVLSFIVFVLLKILLLFVCGLCVIVTCDFFVKRPRMIILSALYITLLSNVVYDVLNFIAQLIFGSGAVAAYALPIGALNILVFEQPVTYLSGLIVCVLYLSLCVILEVAVIPKKDLI